MIVAKRDLPPKYFIFPIILFQLEQYNVRIRDNFMGFTPSQHIPPLMYHHSCQLSENNVIIYPCYSLFFISSLRYIFNKLIKHLAKESVQVCVLQLLLG